MQLSMHDDGVDDGSYVSDDAIVLQMNSTVAGFDGQFADVNTVRNYLWTSIEVCFFRQVLSTRFDASSSNAG